jgi:hypothetical protein
VLRNKFIDLEKYFTYAQLTELTKSMNTVQTVWLKRYCNKILSNYLSQNSYEITKLLKDIGLLTKGDKFSIENSSRKSILINK